jgi:predicted nucleotidyltransferase
MDARSSLGKVAKILKDHRVEAILIGNAAAALRGAPVTTDDFDFLFRPTPANIKKLEAIAAELGADLVQPNYPLSHMYRIMVPKSGLQIDMMGRVYGVKSFESVRSRSENTEIDGRHFLVASLRDVIAMKKAAGRPKDLAVMPLLLETLDEEEKR